MFRAKQRSQKSKHHRPVRLRHLSLVLLALLIGLGSVFQIGVYYGKRQAPSAARTDVTNRTTSPVRVISSHGFALSFDENVLSASATAVKDGVASTLTGEDLGQGQPLVNVVLSPKAGMVESSDAAAQLSVRINPDVTVFTAARQAAGYTETDAQVAAGLFPVVSDAAFSVEMVSEAEDKIGDQAVLKRVYQHTPRWGSGGEHKVFSAMWSGVASGRAFSLHLQGLTGSSNIPAVFQPVFDSFNFQPTDSQAVLGLSTIEVFGTQQAATQEVTRDYVVDSVSPAVVKIYHATCGRLLLVGSPLGEQSCNLQSGSGFFVSSDGYIATNGHVVTNDAEDIFVSILLSEPTLLLPFLRGTGLSDSQISTISEQPSLLASIIAKIYDLPEDDIRLENETHTYLVALGDDPVVVRSAAEVPMLNSLPETPTLKRAELVDTDYSSKDLYVVAAGDEAGFSSSDVALLKVNRENTPFITLFDDLVSQNMAISIMGFPGDAENQLTDNSTLGVSVTNGTISAIRNLAGGKYTLYQSDADASRGNSGGPVITSSGDVLGLLTYRYKSSSSQDAAKSYILSVADLEALGSRSGIEFVTTGEVQSRWEAGLKLYAENRFSQALEEFAFVKAHYPPHRLVDSYMASAQQAIAEGRDVKEFPIGLAVAAATAVVALAAGIWLMVRHHGHHTAFKLRGDPSSPAGTQPGADLQSTTAHEIAPQNQVQPPSSHDGSDSGRAVY